MQILLVFISILLFILIINTILLLCGVGISTQVKTKKSYDLFEYDYNKLCRGIIPNINCKNNHNTSGSYYGGIKWTTSPLPEIYMCTLYLQVTIIDGLWTDNWWISVYDKTTKTTAGTLRWSSMFLQPYNKNDVLKGKVPFVRCFISAGSNLFQQYQNATCIVDYRQDVRKIHIFTEGGCPSHTVPYC